MKMYDFDALKRISAYVAENRLKAALEAEIPHMVVETEELKVFDVGQIIDVEPNSVEIPQPSSIEDDGLKSQRLD